MLALSRKYYPKTKKVRKYPFFFFFYESALRRTSDQKQKTKKKQLVKFYTHTHTHTKRACDICFRFPKKKTFDHEAMRQAWQAQAQGSRAASQSTHRKRPKMTTGDIYTLPKIKMKKKRGRLTEGTHNPWPSLAVFFLFSITHLGLDSKVSAVHIRVKREGDAFRRPVYCILIDGEIRRNLNVLFYRAF